ncbi:MAG TPA: DUF4340 domain-containing protein [Thermoanaerobaculia bacterium]|jgi:hypothetical protein
MSDTMRTLVHAAIALALACLVVLTRPALPQAAVFEEQGGAFYPEFTDPLAAASLDVTDYDEASARTRQFKVVLKDGKWIIPSKWDHPADAKDRLAKTAAAMIGLHKDDVRSDEPKDHELYGVVDPTEPGAATSGRGARITLRDAGGKVLAEFIFGKAVKEKAGYRYVRRPGQKRVYEIKVPYEVSAKFSDWVETDLLQVSSYQLKKLLLDSYTIDEAAERIRNQELNTLAKDDKGEWRLDTLGSGEELKKDVVDELVSALDELKIVDVRRKPDELAKHFRSEKAKLTRADLRDLAGRGFYAAQGRLYANEGEMSAHSEDGVEYHLWFGEIVSDADEGKELGKESRYLLIQTQFDESKFPAVPEPKEAKEDGTAKSDEEKKRDQEEYETKKKERDSKLEAGKKREQALARRFADWYYVISADSFRKLRKTKADLVKKPEEKKPDEKKPEEKKPEPKKPEPKK